MGAIDILLKHTARLGHATDPEKLRKEFRSISVHIDNAIIEAFYEERIVKDPLLTVAVLDGLKSFISREYFARRRMANSLSQLGFTPDQGLYITISLPEIIYKYFQNLPERDVVCSLYLMSDGQVWAALLNKQFVTAFSVIDISHAPVFLKLLDQLEVDLREKHQPSAAILDEMLRLCGDKLIPRIRELFPLRRLIIVPHRRLHLLPWHACYVSSDNKTNIVLLNLVHEISYASSIYELYTSHIWPDFEKELEHAGRMLLIVDTSDPAIPWTTIERKFALEKQKGHWPVDIVTADDSLPDSMLPYVSLTWSGHASSSTNAWAGSVLRLGKRLITADEIINHWRLRPGSSVSLCACETGVDLSMQADSDEYCGLDLAFRIAGANSVVSSLWPVYDTSAALCNLLVEQYRVADNCSVARALNEFQRNLISGDWHWHLPTEEQAEALTKRFGRDNGMRDIVRELRKLDPLILKNWAHWMPWRCLSV